MPLSHVEAPTLRMHLHCLLLLLIPNVALSQEHNESTVKNMVESYEKEREGNFQDKVLFPDSPHSNDHPTQAYIHASNNTRARSLHNRLDNSEKCKIRWESHKGGGPTVTPADSSHIWVSWDWDWFYTHCFPCRDDACDPEGQVIVLVDGEPQTIQLRDNTQHFALVKADPCLKHEISMKVFSFSEETRVTTYNSNVDKNLP